MPDQSKPTKVIPSHPINLLIKKEVYSVVNKLTEEQAAKANGISDVSNIVTAYMKYVGMIFSRGQDIAIDEDSGATTRSAARSYRMHTRSLNKFPKCVHANLEWGCGTPKTGIAHCSDCKRTFQFKHFRDYILENYASKWLLPEHVKNR